MASSNHCPVCGEQSSLHCSSCKNVVYCGKEHQKMHWKMGHKQQCRCYEIAIDEVLGRHMRAARNIKKGEVMLREKPLIFGPKIASSPICLGCHRILPAPTEPMKNYYKCSKCFWPLCSSKCEQAPAHVHECALMVSRMYGAKIDFHADCVGTDKKESAYCTILPLRCMLMKERDPEQYQLFDNLEDNLEKLLDTEIYKMLRPILITFFKQILAMKSWSQNEIMRIAAKLDTNAFEVRLPSTGCKLRAIYPTAAMFSHNCVANARHTFDDLMQIIFIAKTDIAKGEIISTSYTHPLKCTLMRRNELGLSKCIDCTCSRCADPIELGTFCGAITCTECKIGKVVSTEPLNNNADWKCELCPNILPASYMAHVIMETLDKLIQISKTGPDMFEDLLRRCQDKFHTSNTLILQIKYVLTQVYGNVPGARLKEMHNGLLKRKIELCRELLAVADILDPGASLFRGNLLRELEETLVTLAKRELENGLLSNEDFHTTLTEALQMLTEAFDILQHEAGMKDRLLLRIAVLSAEKNNAAQFNLQHHMRTLSFESKGRKNKDKGCSEAEKNVPKADNEQKQSGANNAAGKHLAKKESGKKAGRKVKKKA